MHLLLAVIYLAYSPVPMMVEGAASCNLPTVSLSVGSCNLTLPDGHVYSYGIRIGVNGTQLCASPSTVVANPLLEHVDVCTSQKKMTLGECRSRRGSYLNTSNIHTAAASGLAEKNPNWVTLMGDDQPAFQLATDSPIQLQADIQAAVLSGCITRGDQHTNSHFPLNENSLVIKELQMNGLIAGNSWALDVGDTSRRGRLTLGGYQPGRVDGPFQEYDMRKYDQKLNDRYCPLQVTIARLDFRVGNHSISLVSPDLKVPACIEPYDKLTRFPESLLRDLRNFTTGETGWTEEPNDEEGRYGDLLDLEPGLIYRVAPNSTVAMSMEITLDGGQRFVIPTDRLLAPLSGLDPDGAPVVNDAFREVQVYREPGVGLAPVLGRSFLSQAYLFVDYGALTFKLGPLSPDASAAGGDVASSGRCSGGGGGGGGGGKLGGVAIGLIVVGVVLLAVCIWVVYRWVAGRRESGGEPTEAQKPGPNSPAEPPSVDTNPPADTQRKRPTIGTEMVL